MATQDQSLKNDFVQLGKNMTQYVKMIGYLLLIGFVLFLPISSISLSFSTQIYYIPLIFGLSVFVIVFLVYYARFLSSLRILANIVKDKHLLHSYHYYIYALFTKICWVILLVVLYVIIYGQSLLGYTLSISYLTSFTQALDVVMYAGPIIPCILNYIASNAFYEWAIFEKSIIPQKSQAIGTKLNILRMSELIKIIPIAGYIGNLVDFYAFYNAGALIEQAFSTTDFQGSPTPVITQPIIIEQPYPSQNAQPIINQKFQYMHPTDSNPQETTLTFPSAINYCKYCGNTLAKTDARFCPQCGESVD